MGVKNTTAVRFQAISTKLHDEYGKLKFICNR